MPLTSCEFCSYLPLVKYSDLFFFAVHAKEEEKRSHTMDFRGKDEGLAVV